MRRAPASAPAALPPPPPPPVVYPGHGYYMWVPLPPKPPKPAPPVDMDASKLNELKLQCEIKKIGATLSPRPSSAFFSPSTTPKGSEATGSNNGTSPYSFSQSDEERAALSMAGMAGGRRSSTPGGRSLYTPPQGFPPPPPGSGTGTAAYPRRRSDGAYVTHTHGAGMRIDVGDGGGDDGDDDGDGGGASRRLRRRLPRRAAAGGSSSGSSVDGGGSGRGGRRRSAGDEADDARDATYRSRTREWDGDGGGGGGHARRGGRGRRGRPARGSRGGRVAGDERGRRRRRKAEDEEPRDDELDEDELDEDELDAELEDDDVDVDDKDDDDYTVRPERRSAKRKRGGSASSRSARHSHNSRKVLRKWLEANWEYPYPTEREIVALAKKAELSVVQVKTWLLNSRSRIWRKRGGDPDRKLCHPRNRKKNASMMRRGLRSESTSPHSESGDASHLSIEDAYDDHSGSGSSGGGGGGRGAGDGGDGRGGGRGGKGKKGKGGRPHPTRRSPRVGGATRASDVPGVAAALAAQDADAAAAAALVDSPRRKRRRKEAATVKEEEEAVVVAKEEPVDEIVVVVNAEEAADATSGTGGVEEEGTVDVCVTAGDAMDVTAPPAAPAPAPPNESTPAEGAPAPSTTTAAPAPQ